MLRTPVLALGTAALTLPACGKREVGTVQVAPVPVTAVALPDTVSLGQPVVFEATGTTPTPCWTFARFDVARSGRRYDITAFARYDGRPCVQILGSFTAGASVVPTERGVHVLRFWRTPTRSLELTVVVR